MNHKLILASLIATTALSGCFLDSEADDSGSNPSSAVSSSEVKNTSSNTGSSSSSVELSSSSSIPNTAVIAFTSDGTTGALRWLEGDSLSKASLAFNSDSKVVTQGSTLYVLERYGADNLSIIDLTKAITKDNVKQVSLANASNPMDIAVVNDTIAWVALLGTDYLLAVNPATGKAKDSIDVSEFNADGASVPNAQSVEVYGDTLIAVFQRLGSDWSVKDAGLVVLFDAISGKKLKEIELSGKNPFDALVVDNKLYVGCQGYSMGTVDLSTDRSLDVVDLSTGKVSVLVTSKALGGAPTSLAYDAKNNLLYVGSYKAWGDMPVGVVDLSTGSVKSKEIPDVINAFAGIAVDPVSGLLYVGDEDADKGGLKVYDGKTTKTIKADKALPMYSVALANW